MESLFTIQIGDLIFYFIVFILSLSVHESAHALTSHWFGDDTARLQGRISLYPMTHIHPIGTILIPLMGFIQAAQGLPPMIGWANPVETNPLRWRNKDMANIAVAAAGPISNFLLALMVFIVMKIMLLSGMVIRGYSKPFTFILPATDQPDSMMMALCTFLSLMLILNVGLAVFNLIPIPPLDGSHVFETLLPESFKDIYEQIRPYSWILLLALLWTGVFGFIIGPVHEMVINLLWRA